MTKQRDLKRRVRERQAKTGESYVAARRHVVDAKPESPAFSVVELIDISEDAARLGFKCRVSIFPALVERAEPLAVLARLRDVLLATVDDPTMGMLADVALRGERVRPGRPRVRSHAALRQFLQRARAGIGGLSDDGTQLALSVAGHDGLVPMLCSISRQDVPTLLLSAVIDGAEPFDAVRIRPHVLYLVYAGRRYAMIDDQFVIGRQRGTCDLQIRDGRISRKHAAVIRRHGNYYIKDLGSTAGIHYKGMQIDNKRIEEGDVFMLADYRLRFTFQQDD